jgi:hypothetical protein
MKMYSKIVIDIVTGQTLECDKFDYQGEVALCCGGGGGGTTVTPPEPSEEELELLRLQLDWLKKMGADMEKMRPFLLQSMRMAEDTEGNLRRMTENEYYESLSSVEQGQYDLTIQAQERMSKAYAGELDISPALEKQLGQSETELESALSEKLGPDWETTTSGIQAKAQFNESAALIREEVRGGVISGGTGAQLANLQAMSGIDAEQRGAYSGFPGQGAGLFAGAGQMAGHYQQDRESRYHAMLYNAQAGANRQAGLMSGFGNLLGAGISTIPYWSAKVLKKNIKTILHPVKQVQLMRGVDFDWKQGGHHSKGVIAEELESVMPEAIHMIGKLRTVEYHQIIPVLIEAIKEQQKQIDALKEEI